MSVGKDVIANVNNVPMSLREEKGSVDKCEHCMYYKFFKDLNYNYNYAIIKLQNGKIIEGKVQSWRDYEASEQLQVTIDGTTYLTNSFNCTLIEYP